MVGEMEKRRTRLHLVDYSSCSVILFTLSNGVSELSSSSDVDDLAQLSASVSLCPLFQLLRHSSSGFQEGDFKTSSDGYIIFTFSYRTRVRNIAKYVVKGCLIMINVLCRQGV